MGQKESRLELEGAELRVFTQALLRDVRALESMLAGTMIERGVRRIGLEQELFLVDEEWRPAPIALDLLERLDDPRVTTEIGRCALEAIQSQIRLSSVETACLRSRPGCTEFWPRSTHRPRTSAPEWF